MPEKDENIIGRKGPLRYATKYDVSSEELPSENKPAYITDGIYSQNGKYYVIGGEQRRDRGAGGAFDTFEDAWNASVNLYRDGMPDFRYDNRTGQVYAEFRDPDDYPRRYETPEGLRFPDNTGELIGKNAGMSESILSRENGRSAAERDVESVEPDYPWLEEIEKGTVYYDPIDCAYRIRGTAEKFPSKSLSYDVAGKAQNRAEELFPWNGKLMDFRDVVPILQKYGVKYDTVRDKYGNKYKKGGTMRYYQNGGETAEDDPIARFVNKVSNTKVNKAFEKANEWLFYKLMSLRSEKSKENQEWARQMYEKYPNDKYLEYGSLGRTGKKDFYEKSKAMSGLRGNRNGGDEDMYQTRDGVVFNGGTAALKDGIADYDSLVAGDAYNGYRPEEYYQDGGQVGKDAYARDVADSLGTKQPQLKEGPLVALKKKEYRKRQKASKKADKQTGVYYNDLQDRALNGETRFDKDKDRVEYDPVHGTFYQYGGEFLKNNNMAKRLFYQNGGYVNNIDDAERKRLESLRNAIEDISRDEIKENAFNSSALGVARDYRKLENDLGIERKDLLQSLKSNPGFMRKFKKLNSEDYIMPDEEGTYEQRGGVLSEQTGGRVNYADDPRVKRWIDHKNPISHALGKVFGAMNAKADQYASEGLEDYNPDVNMDLDPELSDEYSRMADQAYNTKYKGYFEDKYGNAIRLGKKIDGLIPNKQIGGSIKNAGKKVLGAWNKEREAWDNIDSKVRDTKAKAADKVRRTGKNVVGKVGEVASDVKKGVGLMRDDGLVKGGKEAYGKRKKKYFDKNGNKTGVQGDIPSKQQGGQISQEEYEYYADIVAGAYQGDQERQNFIQQVFTAAQQGDEQAAQVASILQQIMEQYQQAQSQRNGGRLLKAGGVINHFNMLRNGVPLGYGVAYERRGGKVYKRIYRK